MKIKLFESFSKDRIEEIKNLISDVLVDVDEYDTFEVEIDSEENLIAGGNIINGTTLTLTIVDVSINPDDSIRRKVISILNRLFGILIKDSITVKQLSTINEHGRKGFTTMNRIHTVNKDWIEVAGTYPTTGTETYWIKKFLIYED